MKERDHLHKKWDDYSRVNILQKCKNTMTNNFANRYDIYPNRTSIERESMWYPPLNSSFRITSIDSLFSVAVNFDHFQILRAIGKGSFGKVRRYFAAESRRNAYRYKTFSRPLFASSTLESVQIAVSRLSRQESLQSMLLFCVYIHGNKPLFPAVSLIYWIVK